MLSMSPRWVSEKLWAEAICGAPHKASANRAGASKRNDGIGKSFWFVGKFSKAGCSDVIPQIRYVRISEIRYVRTSALVALWRLGGDDVVGPDPSGGADRETGFRTRGEVACGLVVAAQISGLRGGQI